MFNVSAKATAKASAGPARRLAFVTVAAAKVSQRLYSTAASSSSLASSSDAGHSHEENQTSVDPVLDIPHAESSSAPRRTITRNRNRGDGARSMARVLAAMKAKSLANALREQSLDSNPTTLSPTSSSATSSSSLPIKRAQPPNLSDLLALQPQQRMEPTRRGYADAHARVCATLSNAFVRAQLVQFARELQVYPSVKDSKAAVIQMILDTWGWVRPNPLVSAQRGTKEYNVPTAELFLLQRDPEATQYLSSLNDVKIQFQPALEADSDGTTLPREYILRVRGILTGVTELGNFLASRSKTYTTVEWDAHTMRGLRPSRDFLLDVSNITGAYVDQVGWSKFVATATTAAAAERARDMLLLAAFRSSSGRPPLMCALPQMQKPLGSDLVPLNLPDHFALVPHLPATSSPLPWDTRATVSDRALFRFGEVADKRERASARERALRDARMEKGKVVSFGTDVDLTETTLATVFKNALAAVPPVATNPDSVDAMPLGKSIVLKFGHLLALGDAESSKTFHAPLPGSWALSTGGSSKWSQLSTPIYSPSLPPSLVHFPLQGLARRYRQVRYRVAPPPPLTPRRLDEPAPVLKLTYAYPRRPEHLTPKAEKRVEPLWFDQLGKWMESAKSRKREGEDPWGAVEAGTKKADRVIKFDLAGLQDLIGDDNVNRVTRELEPLVIEATLERSTTSDILFPERPIDSRMIAVAHRMVPSTDLPAPVTDFFTQIHAGARQSEDIGLEDLEGLRTGVPTHRTSGPISAVTEIPDQDIELTTRADDIVEKAAEALADTSTDDTSSVAPAPIVPPPTIQLNDTLFTLISDEIMDVLESSPSDAIYFPSESSLDTTPDEPYHKVDEGDGVTLRTLVVADVLGLGGVTRYAELEAKATAATPASPSEPQETEGASSNVVAYTLPSTFWRELANVTREIKPGAGSKSIGRRPF